LFQGVQITLDNSFEYVKVRKKEKKMREIKGRTLHDFVLVEILQDKSPSTEGVLIPQDSLPKPMKGKVLSRGTGRWDHGVQIPMSVNEGNTILFRPFAGVEAQVVEGKECILIEEREIMFILDEED
jgi:co-chaperonin GroES (HSP10)